MQRNAEIDLFAEPSKLMKRLKIKNLTVSKKGQVQGAQISRSEAYFCTPQRPRDAAQRRN
jgi:hypothetical protein